MGTLQRSSPLSLTTRVRNCYLLLNEEMCTCDLARVLGVSESAASQHLQSSAR